MHRERNPNLQILEMAVDQLGPLADDMVFLGGCATGLLLTDVAAPPIRVTQDVDVITEVASLGDYHRLSGQLRKRGFKEDQSPDAPICRWVAADVVLDVMPTRPEILGFGNEWYQPALDAAVAVALPSGKRIRMVTAPYFLATKLAAFNSRGKGDYVMSHDMEDIVAVLDGRPEIVDEVKRTDEILRKHLMTRFAALLRDTDFVAALPGHLPGDAASQARTLLVMERITEIVESR
jgi:predicted nucleotidyltransferase